MYNLLIPLPGSDNFVTYSYLSDWRIMITFSSFRVLMSSLFLLTTAFALGFSSLNAGTESNISGGNVTASRGNVSIEAGTANAKLLSISDLVYHGAFRISGRSNGVSSMNYSHSHSNINLRLYLFYPYAPRQYPTDPIWTHHI